MSGSQWHICFIKFSFLSESSSFAFGKRCFLVFVLFLFFLEVIVSLCSFVKKSLSNPNYGLNNISLLVCHSFKEKLCSNKRKVIHSAPSSNTSTFFPQDNHCASKFSRSAICVLMTSYTACDSRFET